VGVGGEQHLHVLRILGQLRRCLSSRGRHGCCWGLWRWEGEEKEEGSLCGSGGAKGGRGWEGLLSSVPLNPNRLL
jgi:hypothetical protein